MSASYICEIQKVTKDCVESCIACKFLTLHVASTCCPGSQQEGPGSCGAEKCAGRHGFPGGKTQGNVIEVLSGINDGEEIIQEGARSVKEGQTVKVLTVETKK